MGALPGDMEASTGVLEVHHRAVEAHLGAVKVYYGAVPAHLKTHLGR